jgi:hypothetical protein
MNNVLKKIAAYPLAERAKREEVIFGIGNWTLTAGDILDARELLARRAEPSVAAESDDLTAKLDRVSRWIDKFPVPTDGATAMMCHLRDVKEALQARAALASPAPIAYAVYGINGAGKRHLRAVKPLAADWQIDDDGLGDRWSGNEPLGALASPAVARDVDFPAGALHNGEAYANRLENIYDFECGAGPLRNCHEWIELRRCLSHIAGYLASPAVSQKAAPEAITGWRDALRWSKANTDYHGYIAFTPGQLEHFVSMLIGDWLPKQAAPAPATQQAVSQMDGAAVEMPGMWEPADVSGGETDMSVTTAATTASASERDQCDGCRLGVTVNPYGMHVHNNGAPFMPCQSHPYHTTAPSRKAAPLTDEQYQEVLRPVLSRKGMQRYLNGDPIELDPSDYRTIIDRAALACAPLAAQKPYGYAMWDPAQKHGEKGAFLSDSPASDKPDFQGHVWASRPLYAAPAQAGDTRGDMNKRLLDALKRLLERFLIVYGEPASGAIPHEVTIAQAAIAAMSASQDKTKAMGEPDGWIAVALVRNEPTSVAFRDEATARAMCVEDEPFPFKRIER